MALKPVEPSAISAASAEMIEGAHESVVQVRGRGTGAGVIWDPEGLVLTNHHVVAGRGSWIQVVLRDGRAFDVGVARRDRELDLALLRIKEAPGGLQAAQVGDSGALRVGQLVYAIGHPWGRLGAVTAGVVSGLDVVRWAGGRARYVQSDVALAPGNSGGPLLNARGEVVGINAMISGRVAFSIPSNAASAWLAGTSERHPRLGVRVLPVELPVFLRRANREAAQVGLVIAAVEGGSPAQRAGLLVGDVLLGMGDEAPDDVEALLGAIARAKDAVRLRVMRGGRISFVSVNPGAPGRAA